MKIGEFENGEIRINVHELFDTMTDEEKLQLADDYALHDPIIRSIVRRLREDHGGPNYNEYVYNLRKAFILMEFDDDILEYKNIDIVRMMRDTVHEILRVNAELVIENRRLAGMRGSLYDRVKSIYGDDVAYKINSMIIDLHHHGEDNTYSFTLARKYSQPLEKEFHLNEVMEAWRKQMQEYFEAVTKAVVTENNDERDN